MNFSKLENLMNHFVSAGYAPGNTIEVYLKGNKVYEYSCGYSDMASINTAKGNQ